MADWDHYTRGAHRIGDHMHAFMQPNGSWGLNNMAVLAAGGQNLLIDTTSDIPLTRAALTAFADADPAAAHIDTVLLTHWHVDHVHGICAPELADAHIVASRIAADFMADLPPDRWLDSIAALTGDAKTQITEYLGRKFDFGGLYHRPPDEIFEGHWSTEVGGIAVEVIETKPSHTRSDSMVHIPSEGVAHVGDLATIGRHIGIQYPFMNNLIDAMDIAIDWDARCYVPGHGPLLDIADMRDIRDYLHFLQGMTRDCHDKGMSIDEANAHVLSNLGRYGRMSNPHSLYFTITMMYAEFAGNRDTHLRRDYPAYLASLYRMKHIVKQGWPQLYAPA